MEGKRNEETGPRTELCDEFVSRAGQLLSHSFSLAICFIHCDEALEILTP
jgi:hypothetical protein